MSRRSRSRGSFGLWFPLLGLIALALPDPALALKAPPKLSELEESDRKALETIAGHSEPLRDAVLKASLHIDALVETQRIQEQSSASFQERIAKLDKKQQEQIWEIVREPGLLDELATDERPSRAQLDEIAARHPAELSDAISAFGGKRHDLLVDIAQIHRRASDRFDAAVADLDEETQQAFRRLVDEPELLSVLVRRVNLVVRLGDSYRKDPRDTRKYLSALADDVAKRNAAAEKEWQKRIESDPKAAAELDQAARDYAEENGYDYDELTDPAVRTRVSVSVNPYPFWFGYPVWYSDVYLYPYGWWYPYPPYFGFYHYRSHIVWWGFPSFVFVDWFFIGHHHHHFAHLSNCFTGHFRTSRFPATVFNVTVNNFVTRADPIDHHRGDWSWGRGAVQANRGGAPSARYADRDRGSFFNRSRSPDQLDRRSAPGMRGPAIEDGRGRGQGVTRGRDALSRRDAQNPSLASPRNDRATARSRGEAPRFFQRSEPQPQRGRDDASPSFGRTDPRSGGATDRGGRGGGSARRGDAPQVERSTPSVDAPAPSRGGDRGRSVSGGSVPSARSDGGQGYRSRGGDGGGWSSRGSSRGGESGGGWGGGSRGGGGSGGGSSRGGGGGGWGHGGGGGFGGDGGGGGGGGGRGGR
jgi:hypothetical protein